MSPILLSSIAGALLLLLGMASASSSRSPAPVPPSGPSWQERVLAAVVRHEAGGLNYGAQNRNWDGAGLSYGILQWTQISGNLGKLLLAMYRADQPAFLRIFGEHSAELLHATAARSLGAVGGTVLWLEPWTSRFKAAGQHPAFQQVQLQMALNGEHWQGAEKAARILGVHTERSYALFFDTSTQQGPSRAAQLAQQLRDRLTGPGAMQIAYPELLRQYAELAASRYRRSTPPTKTTIRAGLTWQQVEPNEWRMYAGSVDLYRNVRTRRLRIVADPSLSDAPLSVS